MAKELTILDDDQIRSKILTIRGLQVMVDIDLAELYNVPIKSLNQAVKRNSDRFPERFMFQLSKIEYDSLRSQFVTLEKGRGAHRKYLPYAFTEQGVAMLSSVLKSKTAVKVSLQVIDAFVAMRRFIASNAQVFFRLDNVEKKQIEHDRKFEQVFDAIETKGIKPEKGIFFNGQVFDAYVFVSKLIRSAQKSIILIDNYVDESTLMLFCKRQKRVKVTIFTDRLTQTLKQDVERFNSQYPKIEIQKFKHSHDRFLIIDDKEVYHIGASLKDLGKKWVGFSRFDREGVKILDNIGI